MKALFAGNSSLSGDKVMKDFFEQYGTPNLGDERTLCDSIAVVHCDIIKNMKKMILGHEYEYRITIDTSPYSFSAEALTVRTLKLENDKWMKC